MCFLLLTDFVPYDALQFPVQPPVLVVLQHVQNQVPASASRQEDVPASTARGQRYIFSQMYHFNSPT